jgi:sulfoxide reductase catalytic subunit YedY
LNHLKNQKRNCKGKITMANIHLPPRWQLPERLATDEQLFMSRRKWIQKMGVGALAASAAMSGCEVINPKDDPQYASGELAGLQYTKNLDFTPGVGREITDEMLAATYNNFYEFTTTKGKVWELVDDFDTADWKLEVTGEVNNPQTFDMDDLNQFALEERIYRHRCVEAWSMVVPWIGFPLADLINRVEPTSKAKYVRMISYADASVMPGIASQSNYQWPYFEGLEMAEAMNPMALMVTGIYGHELPKQHGAPVRLVTPWKYGYKSIKSIVRIELVEEKPETFWSAYNAVEYPFESNVDPTKPHPRWSQATERMLGKTERVDTLPYNGYGPEVASLYT